MEDSQDLSRRLNPGTKKGAGHVRGGSPGKKKEKRIPHSFSLIRRLSPLNLTLAIHTAITRPGPARDRATSALDLLPLILLAGAKASLRACHLS